MPRITHFSFQISHKKVASTASASVSEPIGGTTDTASHDRAQQGKPIVRQNCGGRLSQQLAKDRGYMLEPSILRAPTVPGKLHRRASNGDWRRKRDQPAEVAEDAGR